MTDYLTRIWRLRYFWFSLVRMDLRNRYRRSALGIGWTLLQPVAMTIILCMVFSTIFKTDVQDYAPFLLAGLITWNYLTSIINQGCQCFFQAESYIRQTPAPLAIYPLRATLGASVHFLIGLSVVLVLVWGIHGFGNVPALLSLLPSLALFFVMGWSVAVCMGVVNVIFTDTKHLTEVLIQILFYVTPIIYPAEMLRQRKLDWFLAINPVATFLELIRQPILEGRVPSPATFALATLITVLALSLAALTLRKAEGKMIFYL